MESLQQPLTHWHPAETRSAEMETKLRTENAVDVGDVYWAMLPLESTADRTTRRYEGLAVVLNQQTACFVPNFSNTMLQWKSSANLVISGLRLHATAAGEN